MDCTYKTNRLNMPLLDIIGVSCFNTSFYSGFAFLKTETVKSYEWALEAFKVGLKKQYEKITKGTISPCTGHFTATMGLPCAHKIINSHENKLSLDLIHSHWRIDTLTLDPKDVSNNDGANPFVKLLDELNEKYQAWPLHKNETATLMITNLINQSDTLFEPLIQRPRGRPLKAKKKKGTTSTAQNPSRFEYVESLQKHNPSTSASVVQMSNEVTNEHQGMLAAMVGDDDTYVVRSF
ncbi:protein FAR1-related sequence 5 [Tanacetum coccineum]